MVVATQPGRALRCHNVHSDARFFARVTRAATASAGRLVALLVVPRQTFLDGLQVSTQHGMRLAIRPFVAGNPEFLLVLQDIGKASLLAIVRRVTLGLSFFTRFGRLTVRSVVAHRDLEAVHPFID